MGGSAPIVLRETLRDRLDGHATAAAGQDHGGRRRRRAVTNTCSSRPPASSAAPSMDSRGRLALTLRTDGAGPQRRRARGRARRSGAVSRRRRHRCRACWSPTTTPRPHRPRRGCWSRRPARSRSRARRRPRPTIPLLTVQALVNGGRAPLGAPRPAARRRERGRRRLPPDRRDRRGRARAGRQGPLAAGDDIEVAGFAADRDGSIALEQAMRLEDEAAVADHAPGADAGRRVRDMSVGRGQARLSGEAARGHHLLQPAQHQPRHPGRQRRHLRPGRQLADPAAADRAADRARGLHRSGRRRRR